MENKTTCAAKLPPSTLQRAAQSLAPSSAAASALTIPAFLQGNPFAATVASGFITSIAMYPVDVLRAVRMSQAASANPNASLISAVIDFRRAHGAHAVSRG